MHGKAIVAGVGMVPFGKPGSTDTYDVMAAFAVRNALANPGLGYDAVQQAIVGHVYGDSTSGQRALYFVGMTGIPIANVNNNGATGSTALFLARQLVEAGAVDCILALGFEQMQSGAFTEHWRDRPSPLALFDEVCSEINPFEIPLALRYFGGAGKEYMERYNVKPNIFAKVRVKAGHHAANNPLAPFRKVVTEEEVMTAPMIFPEAGMTRLMACPPACGAAAVILVSQRFADKMDIDSRVFIAAQAMTTDCHGTFDKRSMMALVGADMTREAADQVYEQAGIGPEDLDVVELHDCFAQNEVIAYESLRLCPEGGAEKMINDGDNTYGGRVVTNPSGGLLSMGQPLGATGIAQCIELVEQLRGAAGERQVADARFALQHNLGLGGACVVTLYQRAD